MSNLKSFSVYGLFGTDDVHIPFDENIKILVGENGIGKTQLLNLFYYTLTRNFFRLNEFSFDKLILEFHEQKNIEIIKSSIEKSVKKESYSPKDEFDKINTIYKSIALEIAKRSQLHDYVHYEINRKNIFTEIEQQIESGIGNIEILYFPTYRRVEEDLHNLGYNYDEDEEDDILNQENTLIQFGMDDVQKRFNQIESTINKLLKEGFSKITSEILSQLVRGFSQTDNTFLNNINENDIEIILARVGNELPETDKDEIRKSVKNKSFENLSLIYILQKLVEIYEKQKELDNSVKKFRDICNQYLINKKVFYDESGIKIFIKSEKTDSAIELSKLSSGEKQIISIFSKIYLSESDKRFIVLFDEPELSLSMIWQRQLLPDIVNSGKCELLLAVTHSPFIFDNELDKYAIGLDQYIQPSEIIKA